MNNYPADTDTQNFGRCLPPPRREVKPVVLAQHGSLQRPALERDVVFAASLRLDRVRSRILDLASAFIGPGDVSYVAQCLQDLREKELEFRVVEGRNGHLATETHEAWVSLVDAKVSATSAALTAFQGRLGFLPAEHANEFKAFSDAIDAVKNGGVK